MPFRACSCARKACSDRASVSSSCRLLPHGGLAREGRTLEVTGRFMKEEVQDHQEVEWQFDALDVRPVSRWLEGDSWGRDPSVATGETREISDTYFDTDDWRIYRAGYALRIACRREKRGGHHEAACFRERKTGPQEAQGDLRAARRRGSRDPERRLRTRRR